jgi:hypothetical protein
VPASITNGPDGNLWYTDIQEVVGRLSFTGCQDCVTAKLKSIRKKREGQVHLSRQGREDGGRIRLERMCREGRREIRNQVCRRGQLRERSGVCVRAAVDTCVTTVTGFLPNTTGKCEAAKLKAAGKLAAALINCAAKSAKKDKPQDPNCATKAQQKFSAAFAKADESGPCPGPGMLPDTVVAAAIELFCVSGIPASDSSGRVMAAICR